MAIFSTKPEDQTTEPLQVHGASTHEVVDVDKQLSAIARRVVTAKHGLVKNILTIGENLQEAQELLSDHNGGVFTKWMRDKCGFTSRTGYKYLAAWKTFGSCESSSQRRIDVSAMHVLSAPSVHPQAVKDAVALAGDGTKITPKIAKQLVQEHVGAAIVKMSKPEPILYQDVQGTVVVRLADHAADPVHVLSRVLKTLMEERKAAA